MADAPRITVESNSPHRPEHTDPQDGLDVKGKKTDKAYRWGLDKPLRQDQLNSDGWRPSTDKEIKGGTVNPANQHRRGDLILMERSQDAQEAYRKKVAEKQKRLLATVKEQFMEAADRAGFKPFETSAVPFREEK